MNFIYTPSWGTPTKTTPSPRREGDHSMRLLDSRSGNHHVCINQKRKDCALRRFSSPGVTGITRKYYYLYEQAPKTYKISINYVTLSILNESQFIHWITFILLIIRLQQKVGVKDHQNTNCTQKKYQHTKCIDSRSPAKAYKHSSYVSYFQHSGTILYHWKNEDNYKIFRAF